MAQAAEQLRVTDADGELCQVDIPQLHNKRFVLFVDLVFRCASPDCHSRVRVGWNRRLQLDQIERVGIRCCWLKVRESTPLVPVKEPDDDAVNCFTHWHRQVHGEPKGGTIPLLCRAIADPKRIVEHVHAS